MASPLDSSVHAQYQHTLFMLLVSPSLSHCVHSGFGLVSVSIGIFALSFTLSLPASLSASMYLNVPDCVHPCDCSLSCYLLQPL